MIPYFPRKLLSRSLELIAPTWTHGGRWGEIRTELMRPYADWLAANGVLATADGWADAVRTDLLPDSAASR
ncbi:hypothetical protein [Acrocarpospora sp. B8E8]|uniref:hypothetical protein n=1 Tax=Acrocarpospora sp. B8E8 TaxID=3153572 RepID=UPI00325F2062